MMELANSLLESRAWQALNAIAILYGSVAVIWLLFETPQTRRNKWIVWPGIAVLAFAVLFSMIFEELLPVARHSPWTRTALLALSMALFIIATVVLIYGGRLMLRGVALMLAGKFTGQRASWWLALRPGLLWMGSATLL